MDFLGRCAEGVQEESVERGVGGGGRGVPGEGAEMRVAGVGGGEEDGGDSGHRHRGWEGDGSREGVGTAAISRRREGPSGVKAREDRRRRRRIGR